MNACGRPAKTRMKAGHSCLRFTGRLSKSGRYSPAYKNIIPGLIDGESRILDQYADAINASDRPHITQTLLKQSNELEGKIRALKALETSTA